MTKIITLLLLHSLTVAQTQEVLYSFTEKKIQPINIVTFAGDSLNHVIVYQTLADPLLRTYKTHFLLNSPLGTKKVSFPVNLEIVAHSYLKDNFTFIYQEKEGVPTHFYVLEMTVSGEIIGSHRFELGEDRVVGWVSYRDKSYLLTTANSEFFKIQSFDRAAPPQVMFFKMNADVVSQIKKQGFQFAHNDFEQSLLEVFRVNSFIHDDLFYLKLGNKDTLSILAFDLSKKEASIKEIKQPLPFKGDFGFFPFKGSYILFQAKKGDFVLDIRSLESQAQIAHYELKTHPDLLNRAPIYNGDKPSKNQPKEIKSKINKLDGGYNFVYTYSYRSEIQLLFGSYAYSDAGVYTTGVLSSPSFVQNKPELSATYLPINLNKDFSLPERAHSLYSFLNRVNVFKEGELKSKFRLEHVVHTQGKAFITGFTSKTDSFNVYLLRE